MTSLITFKYANKSQTGTVYNKMNTNLTKALVLNLPYQTQLTRRYMCSYSSPASLFPPLELMSVASVLREEGADVFFKDAVAENLSMEETLRYVREVSPDIIISLTGIDSIEDDITSVDMIKKNIPNHLYFIFGHFPTLFPKEILDNSLIDAIIIGEPENALRKFIQGLAHPSSTNSSFGIIFRDKNKIEINNNHFRANEIKSLGMPSHDLINPKLYYEPFMPRPFGMIQTARGCPYKCNYCIKSYGYGNRLTLRSAEQIIEEIEYLIANHRIKSLRFIDDTFTVNRKRVIDICNLMIEKKIDLKWSCLSRTDNIHEDMLVKMKQAGCKRIYFGIESGSQKILDYYEKGIKVEEALQSLLLTHQHKIETTGFFILGLPNETEEDFKKTMDFSIKSKLSIALCEALILYPGTALYEKHRDMIDFSIFPYVNKFIDPKIDETHRLRRSMFYKNFYHRPSYILNQGVTHLSNLPSFFNTFKSITASNWKEFSFMPKLK